MIDLIISREKTDYSLLKNAASVCISELEYCSRAAKASFSGDKFNGLYVLYVHGEDGVEQKDSYRDEDVKTRSRFGGVFG